MVSVVIPTHNDGDLILGQLDALIDQDYEGDYEIIVADNNSTDGLADRLRAFPDLRIVQAPSKQCAAYARNIGVGAARGELVAFCDADDVVRRSWLSGLVKAAREAPAVGGCLDLLSLNGPASSGAERVELRFHLGYLPYAQSCNMAWWKDVFFGIGGMDETLVAGEDPDISWRLIHLGGWIAHAPDAWVAYRFRHSHRALFQQNFNYGKCNVELFVRYRELGLKRREPVEVLRNIAFLALRLTKLRSDPVAREFWFRTAGLLCGHTVGSFRRRTIFL
jgi:glycosyltransferase involved in cell wall biosynthesis